MKGTDMAKALKNQQQAAHKSLQDHVNAQGKAQASAKKSFEQNFQKYVTDPMKNAKKQHELNMRADRKNSQKNAGGMDDQIRKAQKNFEETVKNHQKNIKETMEKNQKEFNTMKSHAEKDG